jgi:hypothetical protein
MYSWLDRYRRRSVEESMSTKLLPCIHETLPVQICWTTPLGMPVVGRGMLAGGAQNLLTVRWHYGVPFPRRLLGREISVRIARHDDVIVVAGRVIACDPLARLLTLAAVGLPETVQRRQFRRLLSPDLPLARLSGIEGSGDDLMVYITDLSGGGVRVACDRPLLVGSPARLDLHLAGDCSLSIDIEVLECSPQQPNLPPWPTTKSPVTDEMLTVDMSTVPAPVRAVLDHHLEARLGSTPPLLTVACEHLPIWLSVVLADHAVEPIGIVGRYWVRARFLTIDAAARQQIVAYIDACAATLAESQSDGPPMPSMATQGNRRLADRESSRTATRQPSLRRSSFDLAHSTVYQ